uniref:G-protein coupled receptors family 1 profile domain-containing protein n=1 Tax=Strongyloides stercoralis TaxID=6248 RepID=A0A0K0E161_STRER
MMNKNNTELLINKIGNILPFIYPQLSLCKIIILYSLNIMSYILHISIIITIIKSWKNSDEMKTPYFKAVVFGYFIDILNNFFFNLHVACSEAKVIVEYFKNNQSTIHLILWIFIGVMMNWAYYTQNINILFISIIRFISIYFPKNLDKIIKKNYIYCQLLVVFYSFGITLLKHIYCTYPYDYLNVDPRYFNGGKIGIYQCQFFLNMSKNDQYYLMVGLVHSLIIVSIISTIAVLCKIRKVTFYGGTPHQNVLCKQNKEYRLTRYVIVLIYLKIVRLIEDQLYYIPILINGYDESLLYIAKGLGPFLNIMWLLTNSISSLFISKILRTSLLKTFKIDKISKKIFNKNSIKMVNILSKK